MWEPYRSELQSLVEVSPDSVYDLDYLSLQEPENFLAELGSVIVMMQDNSQHKVTALLRNQVITNIVITIFIIFVMLLFNRDLKKRLSQMTAFSKSINDGDLTQTLEIEKEDELGELGIAMQDMAGNIRKIITELRDTSNTLSTSSNELSSVSSLMSSTTEEMNAQSNNVATSVEPNVIEYKIGCCNLW